MLHKLNCIQSTTKKSVRSTSWTPVRKNQLKRLANNCKWVSQRRLGRKLGVSPMTICRQLSKMNISCYKRVINVRKQQNTARIRQRKQRICAKNLPTYYIDRHVTWFWTMKNVLLMIAQTCKETITTTRMTNLNAQIVFALLEKRNIRST